MQGPSGPLSCTMRMHARVCVYVCVHAHVKGFKTPFLLVSFHPKRAREGQPPELFVPLEGLEGQLGGFLGLSPLKIY